MAVSEDEVRVRNDLDADRLIVEMAGRFPDIPAERIEDGVRAEFGRWSTVPVREFVPIFVERTIKGKLRALAK
jgi:hypothetical protein